MVRVSGRLLDFVEDPSIVAQVQVRAREVRPHGDGVMLDHPVKVDYAPSTGTVTFDAAAGTAGVIMWHAVGRSHASGSLPIVVPEGEAATLRECVEAAMLADEGTLNALERLALEVTGMVATIQNITLLEEWADSAKQDAATAGGHAATAQEIATALPTTIQTELDTRVPPKVAEVIGSDTVVRDAAAAAAATAVDDAAAGLVETFVRHDDPEMPQIKEGPSLAWAVTDGDYAALAVTEDGETSIGRLDSATTVMISDEVSPRIGIHQGEDTSGMVWRVGDGDRIALAVTEDGAVDFRRLTPEALAVIGQIPQVIPDAPQPLHLVPDTSTGDLVVTDTETGQRATLATAPTAVREVGGAITWESGGQTWWQRDLRDGPWRSADTTRWAWWGSSTMQGLHQFLRPKMNALGLTDLHEGGVGSDRSEHILGRMGAEPFILDAGVSITAGTAATVSLRRVTPTVGNWDIPGSFGTTAGLLTMRGSVFTFTPDVSGTLTAGTEFTPDAVAYRDAAVLYNGGKNDINAGRTAESVLAETIRATDWLRSLSGHYLVMGHFSNVNWLAGDPLLVQTHEANRLLAEHYGPKFLDLQGYISSPDLWVHTGLTPTPEDLAAQDLGVLPPSVALNNGHFNSAGYRAVTDNLIIPAFEQKGWL